MRGCLKIISKGDGCVSTVDLWKITEGEEYCVSTFKLFFLQDTVNLPHPKEWWGSVGLKLNDEDLLLTIGHYESFYLIYSPLCLLSNCVIREI